MALASPTSVCKGTQTFGSHMKNFFRTSILLLSSMMAFPIAAYWQCPAGVDPNGSNNSGVACYWVEPGEGDGGGGGGQSQSPNPDIPDFYMAVVGHPETPQLWSSTFIRK